MEIDSEKFIALLRELADGIISGPACESSVFIGEVDGCPVRVAVMSRQEAKDEHDFIPRKKNPWQCIEQDRG